MEEGIKTSVERKNKPSNPHHPTLTTSVVVLVKFVQLIHQMWWIEFHKTPFGGSLSTGRWKTPCSLCCRHFFKRPAITGSFG